MHAGVLVDALKRMLRGRGITYAALAQRLGLSEASVSRPSSVPSDSPPPTSRPA